MTPLECGDVLDLLQSLIEKSLVMLEERDDGARYLMLDTIREYAREKLGQRDDAAAVAAAPLRPLLRPGQEGEPGAAWRRAGRLSLAPRGRARQHPQRRRAVAGGARRPVHRRQVRGRPAGLLDPARLLHRRPQARARGACAAGDPGVAGRPGLGSLRRRGTGRKPERPRRGAPHARDLPRAAPRARQRGRHRRHPLDPVARPSAGGRCRGRGGGRERSAGDLQAPRRPHRRGDRPPPSRPDLALSGRRRAGALVARAVPRRSRATSAIRRSRGNASWSSARSRSRAATRRRPAFA